MAVVLETSYTSMDQLPETSEAFHNKQFTEDEWSENEVWDSQEQMLLACAIAGHRHKQGVVFLALDGDSTDAAIVLAQQPCVHPPTEGL